MNIGIGEDMAEYERLTKITILGKKKLLFVLWFFTFCLIALIGRVFYIQCFKAPRLQTQAYEQQTRDRLIAPKRGGIKDRNGADIAVTETVASVSVINSQIKDKERAARLLSEKLELDYDFVLKKVSKRVALERIKTKVDKGLADEIRAMNIAGIVTDEDTKRVYPYKTLASQVIGFVGRDNQGIIGLEAKYDELLKGKPGKLVTETDARGIDTANGEQRRIPPEEGKNMISTIDIILQQYAEQTIEKIVEAKQAKRGAIIMMNPQNGEILAMANKPDFDLNDPFTINDPALANVWNNLTEKERNDSLNQMWRNFSINDTYEPGSTFKVITSAAGLEEGVVKEDSPFVCNGTYTVAGRQIKCWRYPNNHGAEDFRKGVQNSCNPVFMQVAERLGIETFYKYMTTFGFLEKTGIDLPGEARGILHREDKMGPVELATMSFGQSFQITPVQLLRAASAVINGGHLITPHFAKEFTDSDGNIVWAFEDTRGTRVISKETSDTMREILESVVSEGTGNKTYLAGYRIGGKTATSEKLPRRSGKYIASFMAFAPAESPEVIALVLIDEPKGAYYGGQVAGPVMRELLENALPYLGITPVYNEKERESAAPLTVPDLTGQKTKDAAELLKKQKIAYQLEGTGEYVTKIFPKAGEVLNKGNKIILYTE
ncbi:stage V sporulation protein D [Clostridia bacterium]|nr:stage V sporulation protein D [Clostridia bacterium]